MLDLVASDHSPCSPALKALEVGDYMAAWGGISGLQLALSVVWTDARVRGFSLVDIVRWMCAGPAKLAGFTATKGTIAAGAQADLCVFDDAASFVVGTDTVHHRHKVTPYGGQTLRGCVQATYLRGTKVAEAGRLIASERGHLL